MRAAAAPPEESSGVIRRSRYTLVVESGPGEHLLFNTLTSGFVKATDDTIDFLLDDPDWSAATGELTRFQRYLLDAGILVDAGVDEAERSQRLLASQNARDDRLELIMLPHENCNFRCTYCYESFARNKMEPWVVEAIQRLVLDHPTRLRTLSTSWFGGEPLMGYDVIRELSAFFVDLCEQLGIAYGSSITTNAYLLDPVKARHLIQDCRIRHFQITLDGPCEQHDRRRKLAGGGGTFERILGNLRALKEIEGRFSVTIRVNFDHEVAAAMPDFIEALWADFGDDDRFTISFYPIHHMGGATRDDVYSLPLCDVNSARVLEATLLEKAIDTGFRTTASEFVKPLGNVCYAADPRSFIIGADGTVYKCTVAFDDPRNQVGAINRDGTMTLDAERFGLWTATPYAGDSQCGSCTLNPVCQGVSCPLDRLNRDARPCPPTRDDLPDRIRLVAREMIAQEARRCAT